MTVLGDRLGAKMDRRGYQGLEVEVGSYANAQGVRMA